MDPITTSIENHRKFQTDLQAETGLPVFETLVILGVIKDNPELMKRGVVVLVRELMGADVFEEGKYLKFVDNMLRVGLVCKHDFRYHMTPNGERYLKATLDKLMPAMRGLVYR